MSALRDLHHEAVRIADQAYTAQRKGERPEAERLFIAAFDAERQAAQIVTDKYEAEPTRGLLYSGAAALAYQGRKFREAEQMIGAGLAGNPAPEFADKMRGLFERINFERYINQHGDSPTASELHMAITGRAWRLGLAPTDAFAKRIQFVERLLTRTAERLCNVDFRMGSHPKDRVRMQYHSVFAAQAVSNVADSNINGQTSSQFTFDLDDLRPGGTAVYVIDDVMTCLDLFDNRRQRNLRSHITDQDYYNNFVALARQIAPDGADIEMVGFSSGANGTARSVNLTRTEDFPSPEVGQVGSDQRLLEIDVIEGQLCAASATNPKKEVITIIDSDHKAHRISVPIGIGDIVPAFWEEMVYATVVRTAAPGAAPLLQELTKAAYVAHRA